MNLHALYWLNTSIAMMMVDVETGVVLTANPAAEKLTGYSTWQLTGMNRKQLHPAAERSRLEWEYCGALMAESICEGFHIQRKDGTRVPVDILSSGHFVSNGLALAVYGLSDMTGRKWKEDRFLKHNLAMAAYAGALSAFGTARSSSVLLQDVCEAIARQSTYALAWIAIAEDGKDKRIRTAASAGSALNYLSDLELSWSENLPGGQGPLAVCVRTDSMQLVQNVEVAEIFKPWRERARREGIRSVVNFPLRLERGRRGALIVYSPYPYIFDADSLELFQRLAWQIESGVHKFDRDAPLNADPTSLKRGQMQMADALETISISLATAVDMLGHGNKAKLSRVTETARAIARELDRPAA